MSEGIVLGLFGLAGVTVTAVASVVGAVLAGKTRTDAKELRNNGGASLRDAVDRIESKVSTVETTMTGVEATAKAALAVSQANHAAITELRSEVSGLDRTVKGHDDQLRNR